MDKSNMSHEKCLGLFYLFGGVIELKDCSYKSYLEATAYFHDDPYLVVPKACEERERVSEEQVKEHVQALLTWTHEIHHLFLFFSSPLSLLIHQLLSVRTAYIQHICLHANRSSISFPLQNSKDVSMGFMIGIIEDIAFVNDVVFGDGYEPLDKVIRKCNQVFDILYHAYKGYFPRTMRLLKLTSDLPPHAFSAPSEKITTSRLLESYSLLTEAVAAGQLGLDVSMEDETIEGLVSTIGDVYSDAFEYFLRELSLDVPEYYHISTFMISTEIALKSPLELNYFGISESMKWQDLHPSYRFGRIINKIKEIGFFKDPSTYRVYFDSMCQLLGWPSLSEIAERSSEIEYLSPTSSGLESLSDPMIDALAKYVIATHKATSYMNHKWPGGHLMAKDNPQYLEYFTEHFKPPFSIADGKLVVYDDLDIVFPRLKEFLMYILSKDVYYSSRHENFDYFRSVLFDSYDNFAHIFKDKTLYVDACDQLAKGCLRSLGIKDGL